MIRSTQKPVFIAPLMFLIVLALAACGPTPTPIIVPTITTGLPTPTATVIPPAITVNGEIISVADYKAELGRYQKAQDGLGNKVSPDQAVQAVRDEMVDTLLLAQGAAAQDFVVDDALLQARIDTLVAQLGGADTLTTWESAHGYTDGDFRSSLRRQVAAAWMRDQITASVPVTAEQVHVKQILLYNAGDAQQALSDLEAGRDFSDLAAQWDPVAKGELGWFPRGYIPSKVIEDAAFALQPGKYSAVIQDETGYHILYLVERDPARPLSPDALLTLQEHAVQGWLTQQRNKSAILFAP
jgi:parvulin-like peptidyl-prolyl isomerase